MFQKLVKAMLLTCLLMLFVTAVTALAATPAQQGATCDKDYVVQADDSLSKLAEKFYGNLLAYPAIFDATNEAAAKGGVYKPIANPDIIEVGQTLCMPPAADIETLLGATKVTVATGKTGGVINITPARFFPEGTTVDKSGNFYVGSMYEGSIYKAAAGAKEAEPFIKAGENGLVSVLGLYADDATNTLWACSSDAGNGKLTGTAPVAVKAFDLQTGAAKGSYDFPGGGFCNDLTVDAAGNVYASDSWSPRVLRLPVGGKALEEWVKDPVLGADQWSLNGLDIDQGKNVMYIVNQAKGQLFRIPVNADGKAGAITEIKTSQPLRRPDGLKVIDSNTLATAEGAVSGMAVLTLNGDKADVRVVNTGLNGVATFALYQGSAWLVENQADHFWGPDAAGPDAQPPFRLVEVPLN